MEEGLQYAVGCDSDGNPLEGGKKYRFHLPPDIPAIHFWSVIVYDSQTSLIIQTDQKWPSVYSNSKKHLINQDGSIDVWFGPDVSDGKENNWIRTIPGKGWKLVLRLYGPTELWFNKTWKPGEVEVIK